VASYDLPDPSSIGLDTRKLPDAPPVTGTVSYGEAAAGSASTRAPALPKIDTGSNPVAARIRQYALESSGGDEDFANFAVRIAKRESTFNETAVSPPHPKYGEARGSMQVIRDTFKSVGGKNWDDWQDVERAGVRYALQNWKEFNRDPRLTAAAYHAGTGAVRKAGGIPDTKDQLGTRTARYVFDVTGDDSPASVTAAAQDGMTAAPRGKWKMPPIEGNVEYPKEQAPSAKADKGLGQTVAEQFSKGIETAGLGMSTVIGSDPATIASQLKDTQIPRSPQEQAFDDQTAGAAKAFDDAKGFGETFRAGLGILGVMARNPKQAAGVVAQSLGMSVPGFAAAGLGAAAGSVIPGVGTAVGAFVGYILGNVAVNVQIETAQKVEKMLAERGVDTNDAAATQQAIEADPEFYRTAREAGIKSGVATGAVEGAVDLATVGLAGKAAAFVRRGATTGAQVARGAAAGVGAGLAQGASEGAGSIAGQAASGEPISLGQAATEAAYGTVAGVPDIAMAFKAGAGRAQPSVAPPGVDPVDPNAPGAPPPALPGAPPMLALPAPGRAATDAQFSTDGPPPEMRQLPPPAPGSIPQKFEIDSQGNVIPETPDQRMAEQNAAGTRARKDAWLEGFAEREFKRWDQEAVDLGTAPTRMPGPTADDAGIQAGDMLFNGRRPFMLKTGAEAHARQHGGKVVPVKGGFVVRPEPMTPRRRAMARPDIVDELRTMANLAGWAEVGGKMIRRPGADGTAQTEEVTRTKWIPRDSWWGQMNNRLPKDTSGDKTRALIEKAIAGEPLTALEGRVLDEMIGHAEDYGRMRRGEIDEFGTPIPPREPDESAGGMADPAPDEMLLDPVIEPERDAIEAEADLIAEVADDDELDAFIEAALKGEGGMTDAELQAWLGPEPARPDEAAANADGAQGAVTEGAGGGDPVRRPEAGADRPGAQQPEAAEGLTQPTPEDLRAKDEAKKKADAKKAAEDKAPPASDFTLTGSNRPADIAAANGQQELAPAPAPAPAPPKQPLTERANDALRGVKRYGPYAIAQENDYGRTKARYYVYDTRKTGDDFADPTKAVKAFDRKPDAEAWVFAEIDAENKPAWSVGDTATYEGPDGPIKVRVTGGPFTRADGPQWEVKPVGDAAKRYFASAGELSTKPVPAAAPTTAPAPAPAAAPKGDSKFAGNKVFTQEAAEKARAILKAKLGGGTLNAGLDPEVIQAGIQLAGAHIEAGARTFASFVRAMVDDLGDVVRPYLKGWYLAAKNYPGFDAAGMDKASVVEDADVEALAAAPADEGPTVDWERLREMPGHYGDARRPLRFASGMSRAKDAETALAAGQSIGVEIGEVSPQAATAIAEALVKAPGYPYLFVDTGAFSVFRANLRAGQAGQTGFEDFGDGGKGLDFDAILDRFGMLDDALAKADRSDRDDGSTNARAFFVMPDIVGDQIGSIELARKYKDEIRARSIRAIVPLQKGPLSVEAAFDRLLEATGQSALLIGVPSNEKAFGLEDLEQLVRARGDKIEGLHFLGAASDAKLQPKLDLLELLGYDGNVSADANRLRALISGDTDRAKAMRDLISGGMTGAGGVAALSAPERKFVMAAVEGLKAGSLSRIVDVRRLYEEKTGQKAEGWHQKRADELTEVAIVEAATEIVSGAVTTDRASYAKAFDALVAMYGTQPILGTRTSTSVEQQAYSTPAPLAYLASRLAAIGARDRVYEPTAGTGMLLMEAPVERAVVNELNPERAALLRAIGYSVTSNDASAYKPDEVDVVIANPPFGVVRVDGQPREFAPVAGTPYRTREIDHAIAFRALEALKDDGRAVLIVGSVNPKVEGDEGRADAYNGKSKREFYYHLYQNYNVTQHFTVSGDLYKKQGAAWPVDVIVIEGRGKSALKLPAVQAPAVYDSWNALKGLLNDADRVDAGQPAGDGGRAGGAAGTQPGPDTGLLPGVPGNPGAAPGGSRGGSRGGRGRAGADDGAVGQLFGDDGPDGRGGVDADLQQPGTGGPTAAGRDSAGGVSPAGDVVQGARGDGTAGGPGAAGGAAAGGNRQSSGPSDLGTNANQVGYAPASEVNAIGTLMPVNMREAVAQALAALRERVGPIDAYVARELGYEPAVLGNYFGAEQVDALGLALDSMSRGAGFIIGDQTGIGKGRVVAGVIRWALKNGKTPIFVTEKPNLYGDMFRDLTDIGVSDIRPVMTNQSEKIPLDEEGKVTLKPMTRHNERLKAMAESGKLEDANIVFTTYSQMQFLKGAPTVRNEFLSSMAQDGVVIFDESHNAGGQDPSSRSKKNDDEQPGKQGRAGFARRIAGLASGVFYSSATWAKRPEVMDLYFKTDMALAVGGKVELLAGAIQAGGVPLQQVVSAMLAKAGQYIRRERSFNGVEYSTTETAVDHKAAEAISRVMLEVARFDKLKKAAVKAIDKEIREDASTIAGDDSATGQAGATSTNFTSIMHNLIDQMLLSLKTDAAVDLALQELKAGNKVVLTVANTMGSFIGQYAEDFNLQPGDAVGISFRSLLTRYLERSRLVTIKDANGNKTKRPLTNDELGPEALAQFRAVEKLIRSASGLDTPPISPIDYLHNKLRAAGYRTGEITGRTEILNYGSVGGPTYETRKTADVSIAGRRRTISAFNGGSAKKPLPDAERLDVIVLNQSGSTGLSLHASRTFADQRPRRMLIVQAEKNIDTHMQMLGRIHRTGQVVLPGYFQLVADVPAEKRPAAVLAKKMASLNASTTANRKSAVTSDTVVDFMNDYGDEVAAQLMEDMPDIHEMLGKPLSSDGDKLARENAVAKVTGRIPLLPLADQEAVYGLLESNYKDLVEQADAIGQNMLEAKTMELDARVRSKTSIFAGSGDSPFAADAFAEVVDVKRLGKPLTGEQALAAIATGLRQAGVTVTDGDAVAVEKLSALGRRAALDTLRAVNDQFRDFHIEMLAATDSEEGQAAVNARLMGMSRRFDAAMRQIHIGGSYRLQLSDGASVMAYVTGVRKKDGVKNPVAPGAWQITFAVADAARSFKLPLSKLLLDGESGEFKVGITAMMRDPITGQTVAEAMDAGQSVTREDRVMMTGNLLAAFSKLSKGQIVNYTDDKGGIQQGVLMPRGFDLKKAAAELPIEFTPETAARFLRDAPGRHSVATADGAARVMFLDAGAVRVMTEKSKQVGAPYYLDERLRALMGGDLTSRGSYMSATSGRADLQAVLARVAEISGQPLQTSSFRDEAAKAGGKTALDGTATRRSARPDIARNMLGNLFGARPVASPSRAQEDALAALRVALEGDARRAGLNPAAISGLRMSGAPFSARPIVAALKKSFGLEVVFVDGVGNLPSKLDFDGLHVKGERRIYVAADSTKPFHAVIGHEFLHWLENTAPDAYEAFKDAVAPVLRARAANTAAKEYGSNYAQFGMSESGQAAAGWEELYADTFADVWSEPEFWRTALNAMAPSLAQRILGRWTAFVLKLKMALGLDRSNPLVRDLYTDFATVRAAVTEAMASVRAARGEMGQAGGSLFSRRELPFKESTRRVPEVQQAARDLAAGTITRAQYDAIVKRAKPVEPFDTVPVPSSVEAMQRAISSDKAPRIGAPTRELAAGHPVGLRIDIPSYTNHGIWVVAVHEQAGSGAGKSIGYEAVAAITNAKMSALESAAFGIAQGKAKAPIAVVKGEWKPTTPAEARAIAQAALTDPAWAQVGFDPERHAYYFDRRTMQRIDGASEVIQIGPLTLAKNPVYGRAEDARFSARGTFKLPQSMNAAFKKWFGKSKVVDADGKPLVVYHGSSEDISVFKSGLDRGGDRLFAQAGLYFTADSELADVYAGDDGAVYSVYLSIKNPLDLSRGDWDLTSMRGRLAKALSPREARRMLRENEIREGMTQSLITKRDRDTLLAEGYDGVKGSGGVWIALKPEQIKSATGNRGTFDPTDPDIRRSARQAPPIKPAVAAAAGPRGVQAFRDWFNAKTEVMGHLPDRIFYLSERYKTLGKIERYEDIAKGIATAFADATEADKKELYTFFTTAGAKEAAITRPELRKVARDTKDNINAVGDALESLGMFGKPAEDMVQGKLFASDRGTRRFYDQYLPRLYLSHLLNEGDWRAIGAGKRTSDMGYLKKRQDIPEEVRRVILGEVKDPAFLAGMAIVRPMRDVSILRFLETISERDSLVMSKSMVTFDGHRVTPMWLKREADRLRNQSRYMEDRGDAAKADALAARMDAVADPAMEALGVEDHTDWKQLPDSPRYGRLRGLYVRKEVHDDLIGVYELQPEDMKWWQPQSFLGYGGIGTKATQLWKVGKVTLNPGSQVRNIISNMVMLQLSGVAMHRLPGRIVQAMTEIANDKGAGWDVAKKYGAKQATFASQELMDLKRDAIRIQLATTNDHPIKRIAALAALMSSPVLDKARDFHQYWEYVGKTAKIIDEMAKGKGEAEAAIEAQKWLFDYSLVSPGVRYLRNAPIGSPFLTWLVKAAPRLAEVVMFHPQRLLPWIGLYYSLPMLAAAAVGGDEDDWKAMKESMAAWAQKRSMMVPVPWRDSAGRIQFTDLGPFLPWTMFSDAAGAIGKGDVTGAATGVAGSFISGGPIGSMLAAVATGGVDPFTDRPIVPPGEPPAKAVGHWASYLWTLWAPPWVTESGFAGKMTNAMTGSTNKYGDPRTTAGQAAATLVGLSLYGVNPDTTFALEATRMQKEIADVRIRMVQTLQDRGLSAERRKEVVAEYTDEMRRRAQKLEEYLSRARTVSPELKVKMEREPAMAR
jgi:hypothetical protein